MPGPSKSSFSLKSLARETFWYGLADFIPRSINFALLPLMTRYMVPADYGVLAIFGVVTSFTESLFLLGADAAFARFYPEARDVESKNRTMRSINAQIMMQVALLGLVMLLLWPYGMPLIFGTQAPPFWPIGLAAVVTAVLNRVSDIPLMQIRMEHRPKTYLYFRLASFLASVGAIIYFVVYRNQHAWGNIKGQLVGTIVTCLAVLWFFRKVMFVGKLDRPLMQKAGRYGRPLFLGQLSSWVFAASDRVLIQRFRTADTLGIYQMGSNFILPVDFAINAINFAWMPRFLREAVDAKNYDGITHNSLRIYALILLGLALYAALLKPLVTVMTHDSFHIAYLIAQLLVLYYATRALYCLASHVLAAQDKTRSLAVNSMTAGVVQFALNLVLIPAGGAIAACVAMILAGLVRALHIGYLVVKVWPAALPRRRFLWVTLAFMLTYVVIFWCDSISLVWSLPHLAIKLSAMIFLLLYLRLQGLTPALATLRLVFK